MPNWSLEQDAAGRTLIRHDAAPRFSAYWTSGPDDRPALPGPSWHAPGSGDGTDDLHLYGFKWRDGPPDEATFARLMREAAAVIEAWIVSRL